ncbi:MAG: hypothetical protein KY428_11090 [Bacteroidetes bacterium]|nr:hypothetical protein [Bacteroidota bacterium]
MKIPGLTYQAIDKIVNSFDKSRKQGYNPNPITVDSSGKTEGQYHDSPQLANITNEVAKKVIVAGEEVKIHNNSGYGSSVNWANGNPANLAGQPYSQAKLESKKRYSELAARFSSHDMSTFNQCANYWQSTGQYQYHSRDQRKKNNKIFTKLAGGPPPAEYKPARGYLERGISMTNDEIETYLQAFEIGKLAYIGPSGFSENPKKARSFGDTVILRVYPSKSKGTINAIAVHGREFNSDGYSEEMEVVVGTHRNLRVKQVIKHVGSSSGHVNYEIIMEQEEDGITESLIREGTIDRDEYGFQTHHWKGLSKDTIKLLIKYNNSSIGAGKN